MSIDVDVPDNIWVKPKDLKAQRRTLEAGGLSPDIALRVTKMRKADLGKGCKETWLVQFNDVPIWYIKDHYTKTTAPV